MRTIVPIKNFTGAHNGVIVSYWIGYPVQVDEKGLADLIDKYPTQFTVEDEDGGQITADKTLGWADPNNWEVDGTLDIDIPDADEAHNGFRLNFKNVGTGSVLFNGTIDGDSGGYTSTTQNEAISLEVINGNWALV